MAVLAERNINDLTRSRIGRLLTRYRGLIFVALLALACLLAYADRQHAHTSAPRITPHQARATE